jgi:putative GTP pyrophosphokinase
MTKYSYTKGDIRRLGEKIRSEKGNLNDEILSSLQDYRTSYKESLSSVFNILCTNCRQVRKDSIVTYRIKRFESIINKLRRYPDMNLDRMWDIAGCRCIVKDDETVYKVRDKIKTCLNIVKTYDYIETPQEEGYRSLHVFVSLPGDSLVIEVQIRSQIDHNWATLVEITDVIFNEKLKESKSNPELIRFHLLLSNKDDLSLSEMKDLFKVEKKYRYLEKLSSVFSRNYLNVRTQWLQVEKDVRHAYYIIEVRPNNTPDIIPYSSYQMAEDEYYNRFKRNQNTNMVLTHIPKATYEQISVAYSNYILTVHQFMDDCYTILEKLLVEALKQDKVFTFIKFFDLYLSTTVTNIKNIRSEITESESQKRISKGNKKVKEWINEISRQLRTRQYNASRLGKTLTRHRPKSFTSVILMNLSIRYLNWKYTRRLK